MIPIDFGVRSVGQRSRSSDLEHKILVRLITMKSMKLRDTLIGVVVGHG